MTWTAPDRNGGPPLTDYDVEYRQGAGGLWIEWRHDGTVTTTTITRLRPHADYQVRVRAWNDEAASDWSPPGSGRTNNTAPAFASLSTARSFPENTPPGRNIDEPVSATDADGDPLAYRLEGPDAASFDLDPETGQLRTKPGIEYDHEARLLYSVTVRATDPLNASAIITVAVHVTDVAEKPATPAAPLVRALEESSTSLRVRWAGTRPQRRPAADRLTTSSIAGAPAVPGEIGSTMAPPPRRRSQDSALASAMRCGYERLTARR